ncbi:MAG: hypothetical protein QOG48_616 [Verrucomicrobiota bacterium]|jgi:steroid delta-isomerase-like uncharacterized protein
MSQVADVINAWVAAANSHDAAEIASLYSPQAQLLYAWGELLDGRDSITHHFDDFFRAFPNWSKEPYSLIQGERDWAVLEWQARAAFLGPYRQNEPTGRSFHVRGCGVFHVVNGRIRLHRRYIDRRDWFQQMGLR